MILVLEYPRCSTCKKALQWLRDNMLPYYPLGVYKDVTKEDAV